MGLTVSCRVMVIGDIQNRTKSLYWNSKFGEIVKPPFRICYRTLCIFLEVKAFFRILCRGFPQSSSVSCVCSLSPCLGPRMFLLHTLNFTASLHGTALHCTALHHTALHCTRLHCTALHCTAMHFHCIALQGNSCRNGTETIPNQKFAKSVITLIWSANSCSYMIYILEIL